MTPTTEPLSITPVSLPVETHPDGSPVIKERPAGVPKHQFWKGMPKHAGSGRTGGVKKIHTRSLNYARSLMPLISKHWPSDVPKPEEPIDLIAYAFITRKDPFEFAINAKLGAKSPYMKELAALEKEKEDAEEEMPPVYRASKKNDVSFNNAVGFIPFDVWLRLGEILLNYWYHKLSATQITGDNGGPIQLQPVVAQAMAAGAYPQLRRMAELTQAAIPAVTEMISDVSRDEEPE